jgi:hypothetical protein
MTFHSFSVDQRQHERFCVDIPVAVLSAEEEHAARLIDISLGGGAFESAARPTPGERVVIYLGRTERLEGVVIRRFRSGFAAHFQLSDYKRDRLAAFIRRAAAGRAPDDEPPSAVLRRSDNAATCRYADGAVETCVVKDASIVGASVKAARKPIVGEAVTIGRSKAVVVRHTRDGFAVEFPEYWRTVSPWRGWMTPA